jgi:hypothetical protein
MKVFSLLSLAAAVVPPLVTRGKDFVDQKGEDVHLHCTAWSGAHQQEYLNYGLENQPVAFLIDIIKKSQFNCVRFQFLAALVRKNPLIPNK